MPTRHGTVLSVEAAAPAAALLRQLRHRLHGTAPVPRTAASLFEVPSKSVLRAAAAPGGHSRGRLATGSTSTGQTSGGLGRGNAATAVAGHPNEKPSAAERAVLLAALRRCRSFGAFSWRELVGLLDSFTPQKWSQGAPMVEEGRRPKALLVLTRGTCDVTVDGMTVNTVRAGSCLGEAALADKTLSKVTAMVVSPDGAKTWRLDGLQFKLAIHEQRQRARRRQLSSPPADRSGDSVEAENDTPAGGNTDDGHDDSSGGGVGQRRKFIDSAGSGTDRGGAPDARSPSSPAAILGGKAAQHNKKTKKTKHKKKSPRVSPRVGGYRTVKWIKTRHAEPVAARAVTRLRQTDGSDDIFNDALRHIFADFSLDKAGTIPWREVEAAVLGLESALPAVMMTLVRRQWERAQTARQQWWQQHLQEQRIGGGVGGGVGVGGAGGGFEWPGKNRDRIDFNTFAEVMRGFDFHQAGRGGFDSLQVERRVRADQANTTHFTDFLRTFATRRKITNLKRPAPVRMAQNTASQRVLYGKVASGSFAEVLRMAGARAKEQAESEREYTATTRALVCLPSVRGGVPDVRDNSSRSSSDTAGEPSDPTHLPPPSGFVRPVGTAALLCGRSMRLASDASLPAPARHDKPMQVQQRRRQSALSIARQVMGSKY